MNIIYLLLPVALIIVAIIIWLFMWSVKSDQFDDLEGPAYQILMDEETRPDQPTEKPSENSPPSEEDNK